MCPNAFVRRSVAASALVLTGGVCADPAATIHPTSAPAPACVTAAGWHAMTLGAFRVVALSDGVFDLPAERLLLEDVPGTVGNLLHRARLPPVVATTVNAYLIDTGTRRILIDAGAGDLQGPTLGRLEQRLHAAGYASEAIDTVLLTHLHPDHVGGLARAERAQFRNAVVYVEATEAAFWLDPRKATQVDASVRAAFDGARRSLQPYRDAGTLRTFRAGHAFAPGIRAIASAGHTPGHSAFGVESLGQRLLVVGDLLHVAAVQFAAPAVTIRYDSAPAQARAARQRIFAEAADARIPIAAAHAPFPGIGHVERAGGGYAWLPIAAADSEPVGCD